VSELDPIALQVLVGGLRAACDEMGATLIRSAYSANIKERHDCSTALFDAEGELVMQAEHIPVHLGSMPDAVAAVLDEAQEPGVAWILNDPYRGGTHLPDVTLISPVFHGGELLGFAASRAHHADIGGPTPGGMPAFSRTLEEEGVVIPPTRATDAELERLAGRMRAPRQRLADLRAQQAANRVGETRLLELAARHGANHLRAGMEEILAYAERRTRAALLDLPDGTYRAEDVLEDDRGGGERDAVLRVEATIAGERLRLDFSGTDPQVDGNLNCPLSVTKSAAFFAVRVLTDPDAPPSAGAHRPIEVLAPAGCLLNARFPAAVVAGNVETSSRVADLVIAALGGARPVPAQGQGTMNNLTLANQDSPTTRRSAAVRAPAPTPTAPARSTSRCRTRSTRRSRPLRPSSRCASGSCRCDAAAAATGPTAAATARCASSKRWRRCASPCSPSGAVTHRAGAAAETANRG